MTTGQYARKRRSSGRRSTLFWLDPAEVQAIRDLAAHLRCSQRDAVANAVNAALERVQQLSGESNNMNTESINDHEEVHK